LDPTALEDIYAEAEAEFEAELEADEDDQIGGDDYELYDEQEQVWYRSDKIRYKIRYNIR